MRVVMGFKLSSTLLKEEIQNNIRDEILKLSHKFHIKPKLLLVRVGERIEDTSYEKAINSNCQKLGIDCQIIVLDKMVSQTELETVIIQANDNDDIHGIMVFRPLPAPLDITKISEIINPQKDVDCMSYYNLEKIFTNREVVLTPCTALATIKLLEYYQIALKGKRVCVVGASMVVGKPLAMMFLDRFATVTLCHIYTENLKMITKEADIVVVAIGNAKFFTREYFKSDAVVIDIGVSLDKNNQRSGDVDYDDVFENVKALTPLTNGIGSLTTTLLMNNILISYKKMIVC